MNTKSHPSVKYKAQEAETMASKSDKAAETTHGTGVEIGEKNGASHDKRGVKIKQEKIDTAKELQILWSAEKGFNPEAVEKKKPEVIDLNEIVEVMVIDSGNEDSSLDNSVGSKRLNTATIQGSARSSKRKKAAPKNSTAKVTPKTPKRQKETSTIKNTDTVPKVTPTKGSSRTQSGKEQAVDDDDIPPASGLKDAAEPLKMVKPPVFSLSKQTTLNFCAAASKNKTENHEEGSIASDDTTAINHDESSTKMPTELKAHYVGRGLAQIATNDKFIPEILTRFTLMVPNPSSTATFEKETTTRVCSILMLMLKQDNSLVLYPYHEKNDSFLAVHPPNTTYIKALSLRKKQIYFNNFTYRKESRYSNLFLNCLIGHSIKALEIVEEVTPQLDLWSKPNERWSLRANTLLGEESACIGILLGSVWQMGQQDLERLLNDKLEGKDLKVELRERNPSGINEKIREKAKEAKSCTTKYEAKKIEGGYKMMHVQVDANRVLEAKRVFKVFAHRGARFVNGSFVRLIPELTSRGINRNTKIKLEKVLEAQFNLNVTLLHERITGLTLNLDADLGLKKHPGLTMRSAIMLIPRKSDDNKMLFHSVGKIQKTGAIFATFLPDVEQEATCLIYNLLPYLKHVYGKEVNRAFSINEVKRAAECTWDPTIGGVVGEEDLLVDEVFGSLEEMGMKATVEISQSIQDELEGTTAAEDEVAVEAVRRINEADDVSTIVSLSGRGDVAVDSTLISTVFEPRVVQQVTNMEGIEAPAGGNSGEES